MVFIVVHAKALAIGKRMNAWANFQSTPTNAENHETKNCTRKPIRDVFCRLRHLAVKNSFETQTTQPNEQWKSIAST
jgi:hypothetical protein